VTDPTLQDELWQVLQVNLQDDQLAWVLGQDDRWTKLVGARGVDTHLRLQELAEAQKADR
jgi:polyphosphate kinase